MEGKRVCVKLILEFTCLPEFLNIENLLEKLGETGKVNLIDVSVRKVPKENLP